MRIHKFTLMNEAGEGEGGGGGSEASPEVVARAKSMGWSENKDNWKGRTPWVDASEFVRKADENIPILHKRIEQLDADVKKTQAENKQILEDTRRVGELAYKQATDEFNEQLSALKKEKAAAITDADGERLVAAEDAIEEHLANKPEPPKKVEDKPANNGDGSMPAEMVQWVKENPWYKDGTEAYDLAQAQALVIARRSQRETGTALVGKPLADKVAEYMRKTYPDLTGEPPPSGHEGGSYRGDGNGSGGGNGKGRTFKNLPQDAKDAFQRNIDRKVLGIDPKTKTQTAEAIEKSRLNFVKYYEWDEK